MKMRVHKDLLIGILREHPEDLQKHLPGWEGTAEEAIAALQEDPRQYMDEFESKEGERP